MIFAVGSSEGGSAALEGEGGWSLWVPGWGLGLCRLRPDWLEGDWGVGLVTASLAG